MSAEQWSRVQGLVRGRRRRECKLQSGCWGRQPTNQPTKHTRHLPLSSWSEFVLVSLTNQPTHPWSLPSEFPTNPRHQFKRKSVLKPEQMELRCWGDQPTNPCHEVWTNITIIPSASSNLPRFPQKSVKLQRGRSRGHNLSRLLQAVASPSYPLYSSLKLRL